MNEKPSPLEVRQQDGQWQVKMENGWRPVESKEVALKIASAPVLEFEAGTEGRVSQGLADVLEQTARLMYESGCGCFGQRSLQALAKDMRAKLPKPW